MANIQNAAIVGLRGSHDPLTYTVDFAPSVVRGPDDEIQLELEDVESRAPDQDAPGVRIDGAEVVSVTNTGVTRAGEDTGTSALNVMGNALETLKITGSGELEIASDSAALRRIDAQSFSGSDLIVDVRFATKGSLTVSVGSTKDVGLIVGADLLAASGNDFSLMLASGNGGGDAGLLGVARVDNAAAINALDFSGGNIKGADRLAIGNDEAGGINFNQDAMLDLNGITPSEVSLFNGDSINLSGHTLKMAEVARDALEINFGAPVSGGGGLAVEGVADLTIDAARAFGAVGAPINLTAKATTALTLNADGSEALRLGAIDLSDGNVDQSDALRLSLKGGNTISGSLATNMTDVNRISVDNTGGGDRHIQLDSVGSLKALDTVDQIPGEGVVVTGAGTGTLTLTASAGDISGLLVDGTDYKGAETVIGIDAWVPGVRTVSAGNLRGVDRMDVAQDAFDARIQDLTPSAGVRISANADVELVDGAAERDVDLANAEVSALSIDGANTLNLRPMQTAARLGDLSANGTDTINVSTTTEDGDSASLTLVNQFDARNGDRAEIFSLNIDGRGDLVFESGIDIGVPGGRYVFNADGGGDRDYGEVLLSSLGRDEAVVFAGQSDFTGALVFRSTGQDSATVALNSAGDGTIKAFEGAIDRGETVTLNSESPTGRGANIVRDTSAFTMEGGSTLALTGNQALTIDDVLDLTERDDQTATLDASRFSGDLNVTLNRDKSGLASVNQAVELGSGSDRVSVALASVNGSDDDTFTFGFSTDPLGENRIEGFAANRGVDDQLDFSDYFADIGDYQSNVDNSQTQGLLKDGAGDALVSFRDIDADSDGSVDDVRAMSDAFDGRVDLIGVTQDELSMSNFAMSA